MTEPDFYMTSADTRPLMAPRACYVEERLQSEKGHWLLLVRVEPPLRVPLGRGSEIEWVLAPRWQGETLAPMSSWPMGVHVCRVPKELVKGSGRVSAKDLQTGYWAELWASLQEAEVWLEPYRGEPRF